MTIQNVTPDAKSDSHVKAPGANPPAQPQWWRCWEIYIILIAAAFLRFYKIGSTEFEYDQMQLFIMSRNAVTHGLLLATSNVASIGMYNPPATNYLLMIPAAISANPLGGVIFTAGLAVIGVLLSYFFIRQYYGRLAATVTALLFAVASWPVFYSRFLWNPNFLPIPLVLLFWFMYRGAVSHKKFWFFPAVFFLGLVAQFHPTSIVLVAPLLVALVLAPRKTIRWYELVLCVLGIAFLYGTYAVRLVETHFIDITMVLNASKRAHGFSKAALTFYQALLGPVGAPYLGPKSIFYSLRRIPSPLIKWAFTFILLGGVLLAVWQVVRVGRRMSQEQSRSRLWLRRVLDWWFELRASPLRCGLLILLAWQIIPLIYLLRPSVKLHEHYFLLFLPGPFILVGFCVSYVIHHLDRFSLGRLYRLLGYAVVAVLICSLAVTTFLYEIDSSTTGHIDEVAWTNANNYYDDLGTMQQAFQSADKIAQQDHYRSLIIETTPLKIDGMSYLAQSLHTPTMTAVNDCLLLPAPSQGPALLLMEEHSDLADRLAVDFAHARLITSFPRLSGPPYLLYAVPASPAATASAVTLSQPNNDPYVQLLSTQSNKSQLVSRYQLLGSGDVGYHYDHVYTFNQRPLANTTTTATAGSHTCHFANYQAGSQVIVPLGNVATAKLPAVQEQVSTYEIRPANVSVSLFGTTIPMSTFAVNTPDPVTLQAANGTSEVSTKVTPVTP